MHIMCGLSNEFEFGSSAVYRNLPVLTIPSRERLLGSTSISGSEVPFDSELRSVLIQGLSARPKWWGICRQHCLTTWNQHMNSKSTSFFFYKYRSLTLKITQYGFTFVNPHFLLHPLYMRQNLQDNEYPQ